MVFAWSFLLALALAAGGQEKPVKNPLARDAAAVEAGGKAFQARCAFCHGTDGKGTGRGSNLTSGQWAHGGRDGELFKTIKQGVAGTEMPPHALPDTEIWQLVAYVRSLGGTGQQPPVPGNPEAGEKLFFGKARCSTCHMIRGKGSPFGPELSGIGGERSSAAIRRSILEPGAEITPGFTGVRGRMMSGLLGRVRRKMLDQGLPPVLDQLELGERERVIRPHPEALPG